MRRYRLGSHARYDLKVHLVWVPKYRKRVLTGAVAVRVRDLLRPIAAESDLHIISGKVAADHVHLFISYRAHQNISQIVQWLKGTSSRLLLQEFPHLKRQFWGRHFWARGYFAVTSGTITDDMINEYINEQEGEPVPVRAAPRAGLARRDGDAGRAALPDPAPGGSGLSLRSVGTFRPAGSRAALDSIGFSAGGGG